MEGQDKIHNAKVLSVGAGGLGSPVILYLAAAWIGTIGIIDGDVVDLSNLQRQVIHFTNIQAAEVLKYFTGAGELLTDKLLTFNAKTMDFKKISIKKRDNCPICSEHPTITKLIDYEQKRRKYIYKVTIKK